MQTPSVFDTKPLLRPAQAEEARNEIKSLEARLQSPHIEDKGEVHRQLRRVRETMERQMPRAPSSGEEEGRMVRRGAELLDEILVGMPSQEEMRKAPPGAVDKHMKWEARNKIKIQEWKNLQLRLCPGEAEAANLERHRPVASSLNMDNAHVPGKMFFLPPEGTGLPVTFSDEQLAVLHSLDPVLAGRVGQMTNRQRAEVKEIVSGPAAYQESLGMVEANEKRAAGGRHPSPDVLKSKKKRPYRKKIMSPEERQAFGEKMKAARAAKSAKPE